MQFLFVWSIAFCLAGLQASLCLQNCYLGSNLYSQPILKDESGKMHCCQEHLRENCNTFIMINDNDYICRQCQLGFMMENQKCVKIPPEGVDKKANCINPDTRSVAFDACTVCPIIGNKIFIPKRVSETSNEFNCEMIIPDDLIAESLKNCKASAIYQDIILCHECQEGYYYHGVEGKCKEAVGKLEGCLLLFVQDKCDICRPEYQYNIATYTCVSKQMKMDLKKYQEDMAAKAKLVQEEGGIDATNPLLQSLMSQLAQFQNFDGQSQQQTTQGFPNPSAVQMTQTQNVNNQSVGNINFNANMEGAGADTGMNPRIYPKYPQQTGFFPTPSTRRK